MHAGGPGCRGREQGRASGGGGGGGRGGGDGGGPGRARFPRRDPQFVAPLCLIHTSQTRSLRRRPCLHTARLPGQRDNSAISSGIPCSLTCAIKTSVNRCLPRRPSLFCVQQVPCAPSTRFLSSASAVPFTHVPSSLVPLLRRRDPQVRSVSRPRQRSRQFVASCLRRLQVSKCLLPCATS